VSTRKNDGVSPQTNKGPGAPMEKSGRDTAEGCRERAALNEQHAGLADTENGRRVLERSAASWTTRSFMLERLENGMEARRVAPRLTHSEIAEDKASANAEAAGTGEDG
jgi:hypothetical protein